MRHVPGRRRGGENRDDRAGSGIAGHLDRTAGQGWEVARQARQLRAARARLLQAPSRPGENADASVQEGIARAMLDAIRTELHLSQDLVGRATEGAGAAAG
nr:hypothetical protein [Stenotrophomonas maltophilia]